MSASRAGTAPGIGLVHDYLLTLRGAERTFAVMVDCWPDAPIYTALYSPEGTNRRFEDHLVRTSYLQRLHVSQRSFRRVLPLYPRAIERLPVQPHDLILSSSSAFAHGIRPRADAIHICYCHTPFRYAWFERAVALQEAPRVARPLLRRVLDRIQRWDLAAAERVTHYIANSELARLRIADYYGREATVVHPPVETDRFSPGVPGDFFLVVTELAQHKRVALALEAARRAGRPIKVVGEGPELERLSVRFSSGAEFLGRISDEALADLYSKARALVVPNVEEFGIAAVEAQAAGRPVVAVAAGGALETVVDGETGVLIHEATVDAFAEALRDVDFDSFVPTRIAAHAQRFSTERFKERLQGEVARLTA